VSEETALQLLRLNVFQCYWL